MTNRIEKNIAILTLFLIFLFYTPSLFAQVGSFNLIKFGLKGSGGFTESNHLNSMTDNWIGMVAEASNIDIRGDALSLPFNIDYGYQPFIIIRPLHFLQIGIKIDFNFSALTATFKNPISKQDFTLDIKTKSYMPGIYSYLTWADLELGIGILHSYSNIQVKDTFFGYDDTWFGTNTGYEISLGYSSTSSDYFGYSMSVKYRGLHITDFKDRLNRKVTYSDKVGNMSVYMSGFFVEMGFYLQFIKK